MTDEGSAHHWTNFAGATINAAAGVGTAAVSYGKTRHYLEKANREYFAPRGLQISIYKHERLVEKLGLDSEAALLAASQSVWHLKHARSSHATPQTTGCWSLFRWPPANEQRNVPDKIAAKGVERKIREKEKKHKWSRGDQKVRQARTDAVERQDGDTSDSGDSPSSSSSSSSSSDTEPRRSQRKKARRVHKINRKADKDLRRHPSRAAEIEAKRATRIIEAERKASGRSRKGSSEMSKRAGKDRKQARKMDFLVVEAPDSVQ